MKEKSVKNEINNMDIIITFTHYSSRWPSAAAASQFLRTYAHRHRKAHRHTHHTQTHVHMPWARRVDRRSRLLACCLEHQLSQLKRKQIKQSPSSGTSILLLLTAPLCSGGNGKNRVRVSDRSKGWGRGKDSQCYRSIYYRKLK